MKQVLPWTIAVIAIKAFGRSSRSSEQRVLGRLVVPVVPWLASFSILPWLFRFVRTVIAKRPQLCCCGLLVVLAQLRRVHRLHPADLLPARDVIGLGRHFWRWPRRQLDSSTTRTSRNARPTAPCYYLNEVQKRVFAASVKSPQSNPHRDNMQVKTGLNSVYQPKIIAL